MTEYFKIDRLSMFVKFFITVALFASVKDFSKVISFSTLTVALLEFIIVLELVRMIIEFLFGSDNRIKLRFMIDSTIIFFIRDIMLIANDKFDFTKIASMLGIVAVLFAFRGLTIKFSPSNIDEN